MSTFKPIEDGIFIGPQPSAQDLDEARQQGIKTVIDLRLPSETASSNQALAQSHGLAYRNIPVNKENLLPGQIDELDSALNASAGPVLLHCATGARVALLLGLLRARQRNWGSDQVFEWARGNGFDLAGSSAFSSFVTKTIDNK